MIASVRFWRAIRACLPDTEDADALAIRLRHEPREARKRHMAWDVPLSPGEARIIADLMDDPPTPYLAFCVQHHRVDALAKAAS